MSERRTISVALLEENVNVWRPVEADHLGRDEYRLIGPVPEYEVWEFQPGDIVKCRDWIFEGGTRAMVAFALVESGTRGSEQR